jgi:hypothetical protein
MPPVRGECVPQNPTVLGEQVCVARLVLLEESRRSIDVGEEERDRAGRQLGTAHRAIHLIRDRRSFAMIGRWPIASARVPMSSRRSASPSLSQPASSGSCTPQAVVSSRFACIRPIFRRERSSVSCPVICSSRSGLAQVVLPVLAVATVYAAYRLLRGATSPPKRFARQWTERSWRAWAELIGGSAIPGFVVAGSIALGANSVRGGSKQLLWLDPVEKLSLLAFFLTVLAVLVALNLRARLADRYGNPESL